MNSPKFAHIAEHWNTVSDEDVAEFKKYAQSYYGVPHTNFRVSVLVRETFIDIVIRSPELLPIGLLTIMRNTGTRVVYVPWTELAEWQIVPVDHDSDEFIREYFGIFNSPKRIEIINDLEYIDAILCDFQDNHVAKIIMDKNTGLVIDRE